MNKRVISVLLLVAMLMCFVVPVGAASVEETTENISDSSNIQPRSFYRESTVYVTSSSTQVTADDNWWGENSLVVSMVSNSGPTKVYVTVTDSAYRPLGGGYVSINSALSLNIPDGAFAIFASKSTGTNGNVTFGVSLN